MTYPTYGKPTFLTSPLFLVAFSEASISFLDSDGVRTHETRTLSPAIGVCKAHGF